MLKKCNVGTRSSVEYVAPEVEVIDVVVEKGFANSPSLEEIEGENEYIGW